MQYFINKKIVLGVCGGIAAYKAADLVRQLSHAGAHVRVVMTQAALQFITPMTMQALSGEVVRCDVFDEQAERAMGHIELARWADLVLIAPATADFLAKMAHGLADNLLSTLCLVTEAPVMVCPAMNRSMWAHPATQANCQMLLARGVGFIGPESGAQACGEMGYGRMSEVLGIMDAIRLTQAPLSLQGEHVLVTAGPTREPLDPVRYLSNYSSGKMGYALAEAARMAGAHVTLITGPTGLTPPPGVQCVHVNSAQEMFDQVMQRVQWGIIFIGAAAVADYTCLRPAPQKLKKQDQEQMTFTCTKTQDILAQVAASEKAAFVVGFAAETSDLVTGAREKLRKKHLDMVIANDVSCGRGFESEDNQVVVITEKSQIDLPLMNKMTLAHQLVAMVSVNLHNKRDLL